MDITNKDKRYKSDGTMIYSCQYHIIFTTKYRRHVLTTPVDKRLKELILEKQTEHGYEVMDMEVMPDHVHLLLDVCPKLGPHDAVMKIKGYTAHILRKEFKTLRSRLPCLWTRSKFISTVGTVSLEAVKKYIEDQKGR